MLLFTFITVVMIQDTEADERTLCAGEFVTLHCEHHHILHVDDVYYGRDNDLICRTGTRNTGSCSSNTTFEVVQRTCDKKKNCAIFVKPYVLNGFQCAFANPYLKINYSCHQNRTLADISTKAVQTTLTMANTTADISTKTVQTTLTIANTTADISTKTVQTTLTIANTTADISTKTVQTTLTIANTTADISTKTVQTTLTIANTTADISTKTVETTLTIANTTADISTKTVQTTLTIANTTADISTKTVQTTLTIANTTGTHEDRPSNSAVTVQTTLTMAYTTASNRTLSAMTTENYGTTTNTTDTNISSEKSATFVIIIVSSAAGICLVFILICASVLCKCRRKKWKPPKEIQENPNDLWISVPFSEELISDSNELTSRQNHDIDKSQETECVDYSEIPENVTTRVNDRPLSETDVLSKTRKSICHPKRVTFFNDDNDYISMKDGKVYIQDAHLRFAYVNDRLSAWGSCGELRKSIMTNASGSYINMNTLMQRSLSDLSIALKQPNMIPEQKFLHKSTTKSKS